jgi:hypothetical protein
MTYTKRESASPPGTATLPAQLTLHSVSACSPPVDGLTPRLHTARRLRCS